MNEVGDVTIVNVKGSINVSGEIRAENVHISAFKDFNLNTEGWLHTNDLAVMDEDGYIQITGRLSDMILVGGFNTYPAEIEEFLHTHPKIQDVSVIGVPDKRLGEVAMAYIIPKEGSDPTAEEIIGFCKGKLANFKMPKYVEFVEAFPLTSTGKVQKFIQREMAAEKFEVSGS